LDLKWSELTSLRRLSSLFITFFLFFSFFVLTYMGRFTLILKWEKLVFDKLWYKFCRKSSNYDSYKKYNSYCNNLLNLIVQNLFFQQNNFKQIIKYIIWSYINFGNKNHIINKMKGRRVKSSEFTEFP